MAMIDTFGRRISYMRISVTDRCNFLCAYCAGSHTPPKIPRDEMLTFEEIVEVVRAGAQLGITKVRLTGGEPLLRSNIHELISMLRHIRKVERLSMTTNGSLLASFLPHASLLDSLNISIDTLKPDKFAKLTRGGKFHDVWEPLTNLMEQKHPQVRINAVLLNGINVDEVPHFANLTLQYHVDVRFIEFMPWGSWDCRHSDVFYVPISTAVDMIMKMGARELPSNGATDDGPARYYALPAGKGRVGFISAVSSPFCDRCNRIRLTADGQLKMCLLSESSIDVKGILRRPHSNNDVADAIRLAVEMKPATHNKTRPHAMVSIGG